MLAPRSVIEGGGFVAHSCSHIGIRCQYRRSEWARIVEYPVSALNQFGARIVASEEQGCGKPDAIVRKFIHNSNLYSTIAP